MGAGSGTVPGLPGGRKFSSRRFGELGAGFSRGSDFPVPPQKIPAVGAWPRHALFPSAQVSQQMGAIIGPAQAPRPCQLPGSAAGEQPRHCSVLCKSTRARRARGRCQGRASPQKNGRDPARHRCQPQTGHVASAGGSFHAHLVPNSSPKTCDPLAGVPRGMPVSPGMEWGPQGAR